jgi:hypothetical protein
VKKKKEAGQKTIPKYDSFDQNIFNKTSVAAYSNAYVNDQMPAANVQMDKKTAPLFFLLLKRAKLIAIPMIVVSIRRRKRGVIK